MLNTTPQNPTFAGHAVRLVAAASLACTLATFGCTTDRMPGAGAPQRYAPTNGPTTPSSVPGTEQSRPVNPPMISSYTATPGAVALRRVNTDALAIAAANQSYRGRYLGPADPAGAPSYAGNPQETILTGQFISPTNYANPEITVNSSISSPPTPVISGGGAGGAVVIGGTVATSAAVGSTTSAVTSGITATPTNVTTTTVTPTNATAPAGVITSNLGGFLNPTMSSGSTISPTAAAVPGVGNVGAASATTSTTTASRLTSALSTSSAATLPLIVGRAANGTVTVTNITTVGDRLVVAKPATTTTTTPGNALKLH
jgi:hypothetical protein